VIRLATVVLGILVIGVIVYCIYFYRIELGLVRPQDHPAAATTQPSSPTSQPTPVGWQTINRPADGFKVEMPCGITETRLPAYNAKGAAEPVETIEASPGPGATFAVSWADNPPVERAGSTDVRTTLDLALNGALTRTRSVLVSQSENVISGYQARDFTARSDGGVLTARLILVGNRLYLLLAASPSSTAAHEDDVNRFFNSFTLTAAKQSN
jgi:hypothetical protein